MGNVPSGISYIDDPNKRGGELEAEMLKYHTQVQDLNRRHNEWHDHWGTAIAKFDAEFHTCLDTAFEKLQHLTSAILECTDDELNAIVLAPHASSVIAAIKPTLDAFHSLVAAASTTLQELCDDSQSVMAWENQLSQLQASITAFSESLKAELASVINVERTYEGEWQNSNREIEEYDGKIRRWDNLSWLDQLFEKNAHDQWDEARRDADRRRESQRLRFNAMADLHGRMNVIGYDITGLLNETIASAAHARGEEHRVIDSKKVATEVLQKTSQLENYLISRDIEFSVEEAARHILQIVHTAVAVIDSDVHVQGFKAQIMGEVTKKYGVEGAQRLMETKAYLSFDI